MKPLRWSLEKNAWLEAKRGIGFEEIVVAVEAGALLEVVRHPNPKKYPRQRIMVVGVAGYACLVPFERRGRTQAWYDYRDAAERRAITAWAESNGLRVAS